jgi:hypothetical protein
VQIAPAEGIRPLTAELKPLLEERGIAIRIAPSPGSSWTSSPSQAARHQG